MLFCVLRHFNKHDFKKRFIFMLYGVNLSKVQFFISQTKHIIDKEIAKETNVLKISI